MKKESEQIVYFVQIGANDGKFQVDCIDSENAHTQAQIQINRKINYTNFKQQLMYLINFKWILWIYIYIKYILNKLGEKKIYWLPMNQAINQFECLKIHYEINMIFLSIYMNNKQQQK